MFEQPNLFKEYLPSADRFSEYSYIYSSSKPQKIIDKYQAHCRELLIGYKVFGARFETNNDVSTNGENRYYHISGSYYFQNSKLNSSYGFRFYKSLNDCYDEYNSIPIARICKVIIHGEIVCDNRDGKQQFLTNSILIGDEIINPFKRKYKRVKVQMAQTETKPTMI